MILTGASRLSLCRMCDCSDCLDSNLQRRKRIHRKNHSKVMSDGDLRNNDNGMRRAFRKKNYVRNVRKYEVHNMFDSNCDTRSKIQNVSSYWRICDTIERHCKVLQPLLHSISDSLSLTSASLSLA